jgi:hypothetical protein
MFGIAVGLLIVTNIDEHQHIVKVAATFKRGVGWERTLKLSIYNHKDRTASEVLDALTEKVFETFQKAGVHDAEDAALQTNHALPRVKAAIEVLVRNGMLVKKGKKYRVVKP